MLHVVPLGAQGWHEVVATIAELLARHHVLVEEVLDHGVNEAHVLVVSDAPALVDVGD